MNRPVMRDWYQNQEEFTRQVIESGKVRAADDELNFVEGLAEFGEKEMPQRSADELKEIELMHRLDAHSQHEHHEKRWERQHKAAQEAQQVESQITVLTSKYQQRLIDDEQYVHELKTLKAKREELLGQV